MYDVRSEAHEFIGAGRQEAIEKACQFYSVESDELSISGYEDGAVYGLAARTVIVAIPKNLKSNAPRRSERSEGRREEGGRESRGRDRGGDRDRGRGRDRGRDRDRGRGRDGGRERARSRDDDDSGARRERPRRDDVDSEDSQPLSDEPSVGSAIGEIGEIGKFVLGALERMDLGPFEIVESAEDELIAFELKGPGAQALASGEGRAVDALQLLANQVAARQGPDRQRVVIDVEGNAEAREEFLTKLAERIAKRAIQTGRPVALDPMNGRDRRTIHMALRDEEGIATMSEGEGRYRQVVVVPEGAEEYDEAIGESERSGNI
jgi:predicted RNA-binding protein Jag